MLVTKVLLNVDTLTTINVVNKLMAALYIYIYNIDIYIIYIERQIDK